MRVSEIMQTDLVTCPPTATVVEAARTMRDRVVGAVIIVEGPRLAGILTERDLVRLVADGVDMATEPVAGVMTRDLAVAPPDADVLWVADVMRQRHIRHMPVGEGRHVVGMVSVRDLFVLAESVLRLDPDGASRARDVLSAASG